MTWGNLKERRKDASASIIRQVKDLSNLMEPDHCALKWVNRPVLGFKSLEATQCTLAGVGLLYMLRKGQLGEEVEQDLTPAARFTALAA